MAWMPLKQHLAIKRIKLLMDLARVAGRTCWYCGRAVTFRTCEVDHIVPKKRGGSDKLSNRAIACFQCNRAKGTMSLKEFLDWLKWIRINCHTQQVLLDRAKIHEDQTPWLEEFEKGLRKPDTVIW